MKLNELTFAAKSRHKVKRVGRGFSSGRGKTATRGTKGQNARKSGLTRLGFEGGQTTLYRRIPKVGFNNKNFAKNYNVITLKKLVALNLKNIDLKVLKQKKLLKNTTWAIKIVGNMLLTKPLVVSAHKFSKGSLMAINKAKGKAVFLK